MLFFPLVFFLHRAGPFLLRVFFSFFFRHRAGPFFFGEDLCNCYCYSSFLSADPIPIPPSPEEEACHQPVQHGEMLVTVCNSTIFLETTDLDTSSPDFSSLLAEHHHSMVFRVSTLSMSLVKPWRLIGCSLWIIAEKVTWGSGVIIDLSGEKGPNDCQGCSPPPKPTGSDRDGVSGFDGSPGLSGGKFVLAAQSVEAHGPLTVLSNGADGGNGQPGGDGAPGLRGPDGLFIPFFRLCCAQSSPFFAARQALAVLAVVVAIRVATEVVPVRVATAVAGEPCSSSCRTRSPTASSSSPSRQVKSGCLASPASPALEAPVARAEPTSTATLPGWSSSTARIGTLGMGLAAPLETLRPQWTIVRCPATPARPPSRS